MNRASTSRIGRCVLLLSIVVMPIMAHAESLDAAVSFVEVAEEVAPTPRVHRQVRNLDLSVIDRLRVSDWSARRFGQPNERAQDVKGRVGIPTRVERASLVWRLDGPEIVVRETIYATFVETITIAFRPGGCEANVTYRLNPGHTHFAMWNLKTGAPMPITRIRAEDVRCKLGVAAVS